MEEWPEAERHKAWGSNTDEWPELERRKASREMLRRLSDVDLEAANEWCFSEEAIIDEDYGYFVEEEEEVEEPRWRLPALGGWTGVVPGEGLVVDAIALARGLVLEASLGERWLSSTGASSDGLSVEAAAIQTLNDEVFDTLTSSFESIAQQVFERFAPTRGPSSGLEGRIAEALSRALVADVMRAAVAALERVARHPFEPCAVLERFSRRFFGRSGIASNRDDVAVALLGLDRQNLLVPVCVYAADVLGVDLRHVPDNFAEGYGLLHAAAADGPAHVVRWLLEARDQDPDVRTRRNAAGASAGMTPLHLAAAGPRLEVVLALLDNGASVHARNWPNLIYFQRHAVAINAAANENKTPLQLHDQYRPTPPLHFGFNALADLAEPADAISLLEAFAARGADLKLVYRFATPAGVQLGTILDEAKLKHEYWPTATTRRLIAYLQPRRSSPTSRKLRPISANLARFVTKKSSPSSSRSTIPKSGL